MTAYVTAALHFEQLTGARPDIRFVKVGSHAALRGSASPQIRSIPTTVLFVVGGGCAAEWAMTAAQLEAWVDQCCTNS